MNKTTNLECLIGKEVYVILRSFYGRRSPTDRHRMMTLGDVATLLQSYFDTGVWPLYGPNKCDFFVCDDKWNRYYLEGSVDVQEDGVRKHSQQYAEATGVYLAPITISLKEVNEV